MVLLNARLYVSPTTRAVCTPSTFSRLLLIQSSMNFKEYGEHLQIHHCLISGKTERKAIATKINSCCLNHIRLTTHIFYPAWKFEDSSFLVLRKPMHSSMQSHVFLEENSYNAKPNSDEQPFHIDKKYCQQKSSITHTLALPSMQLFRNTPPSNAPI